MTDIYTLNRGQLVELGNDMKAGLATYAKALEITKITPAILTTQIAAYEAADDAFTTGRGTAQAASTALQDALRALQAWLGAVKGTLSGSFGQRWNARWVPVGFISPSLVIPQKWSEQSSLAARFIYFLDKNAKYEVDEPHVTAAYGRSLQATIEACKRTLKADEIALKDLGTAWDEAYTALTNTMWSLIKLLYGSLDGDDDVRWLAFGLPMPGTPATPGQPQNVAVHADGTGAMVASCDPLPGATRYRFRIRIVNVETAFRLAKSSTEPLASITSVLPGQAVELIVQAVNGGLQSVPSEPIYFTMPLPDAPARPSPAAQAKPAAEEDAAPKHRNGNGSANGNGNAHTRVWYVTRALYQTDHPIK